MTVEDVPWAVDVLARQRARVVPFAPLYWRPSADATQVHHDFLSRVLTDGGGIGCRTDRSLMIAAPGRNGWTVDDACVPDGRWATEGVELWHWLSRRVDDDAAVRLVAPASEPERSRFAAAQGLTLNTSWWHREVAGTDAAVDGGVEVSVQGASAQVVPAPPVYDPGGPILFLRDVTDLAAALAVADTEARGRGCPLIVVEQAAGDRLGEMLASADFVRHCDFFEGTLAAKSPH